MDIANLLIARFLDLHLFYHELTIEIKLMSLMSTFKGILGETVINIATWLALDKTVYHRLNNITLPLAKGGSTQIDHVIVSVYGIFVIETKNYKGWIYGKETQTQWTQAFPNGSKYKFQNPLRQNYLHIKTLADLLELEINYFHSMIAFIGECELKTRDELPEHVLKGGIVTYIKSKQDEILTEEDVELIVEQIQNNRFAKSWRTNRAHKEYLKNKHSIEKLSPSKSNTPEVNKDKKPLDVIVDSKIHIPLKSKPILREKIKSREVHQWSGQVEQDDASTMPFTSKNAVFMTPFEVTEFQPNHSEGSKPEVNSNQTAIAEPMSKPVISETIPACPKCNSEMVERIAKKGQRQGQSFFGCSQFPKCRGVVNVD